MPNFTIWAIKTWNSIGNASPWYFNILQVKSEILIFNMLNLGIQIFCIQNQVLNFQYFDMKNIQLSIFSKILKFYDCMSNLKIAIFSMQILRFPYLEIFRMQKILEFWELACSSLKFNLHYA